MKAFRFHGVGLPLQLDDVPVPQPGPGEVRVAVRACGVCGSDVHIVEGVTDTGPRPLILGHETAGVVDEVGAGVTDVRPGQRVCLSAGYGCGSCPSCAVGAENICSRLAIPGITRDGAQAEYVVVPARTIVPLPDSIEFGVGAILTDAVSTPFHAIRRSGVAAGQTAAVFGLGGLGLPAVAILTQVVGAQVVAVDTRPRALERARAFGATAVVDASDGHPARAVRALTAGADATFEFVGSAAAVDQAVKSLRPGGTCTVVGVCRDRLHLDVRQETLVAGELRIQGSFGCTADDLRDLVDLVGSGRLDVAAVISHRLPLEQFAEAVSLLQDKRTDPVRIVVEQTG